MANSDIYLRAMMSLIGRQTYPPEVLKGLVGQEKQLKAYNLADGTRTQGEITKLLNLDSGNFSRTVKRWVELGVVVKIEEGDEVRLVHLYPL